MSAEKKREAGLQRAAEAAREGVSKLTEKQYFYAAEFEAEGAWLSFMQREGWKFAGTDGWKYRFLPCEPEDWVYHLDFKEETGEDEVETTDDTAAAASATTSPDTAENTPDTTDSVASGSDSGAASDENVNNTDDEA